MWWWFSLHYFFLQRQVHSNVINDKAEHCTIIFYFVSPDEVNEITSLRCIYMIIILHSGCICRQECQCLRVLVSTRQSMPSSGREFPIDLVVLLSERGAQIKWLRTHILWEMRYYLHHKPLFIGIIRLPSYMSHIAECVSLELEGFPVTKKVKEVQSTFRNRFYLLYPTFY